MTVVTVVTVVTIVTVMTVVTVVKVLTVVTVVTKLKTSNFDKIQIVTKPKNSKCVKTQKLKM